jgi:hypothetical protein
MEGFVVNSFVFGKGGKSFSSEEENVRVLQGELTLNKQKSIRKRVPGINNTLKSIFYPDFDMRAHLFESRKEISAKTHRHGIGKRGIGDNNNNNKKKQRPRKPIYGNGWNQVDMAVHDSRGVGAALGEQVHKQLELFSRMGIHQFRTNVKRSDPLAVAIINKMYREWNVTAIWGELEIWDAQLGYATAVDLVCVNNENGRLVFFEVKTGYGNGVFSHCSSAQRKVNGRIGIDNSPLGHAFLQLIIPIETMRRHYGITNIDGYVIHVNDSDCQLPVCYKLPFSGGGEGKGGKTASYERIYNYAVRTKQRNKGVENKKRLNEYESPQTIRKPTVAHITSASVTTPRMGKTNRERKKRRINTTTTTTTRKGNYRI